jgi:alpha-amylase
VRTGPIAITNRLRTLHASFNLPDIKKSLQNVALPPFLVEKWKKEGRYEQEIKEIDAFFARTGYPRAPKYYIIKWLTVIYY